MCNILPDLVLIETLVGSTMQTWELLVQTIGNRLSVALINIGGETDAQDSDDRRGSSDLRIEVNRIVLTAGSNKAAERATPAEEAAKRGVNTHTNSDDTEYNQRNGH